jgi:putative PIN family toxin of toxin-antitoxin system
VPKVVEGRNVEGRNVVVSGILKNRGNEAAVLDLISDGALTLYIATPIFAEYRYVLTKKLGFDPGEVKWLFDLVESSVLVAPTEPLAISTHEADNRIYECAAASKADYIVTGNKKHFPKGYENMQLVNPRELLERLRLMQ